MSGVYNQSGESLITKAEIHTFSDNLPDVIASFQALYVKFQEEDGEQTTDVIEREIGDREEQKTGDNTNELSATSVILEHKMLFVKFEAASDVDSDWEDIGSQTDHSDLSEGHYSDETTEEKQYRETRNKTKSEKKTRRMEHLNKKYQLSE
ncbi:hypothetical protein CAEBREN_17431 [Caenorhabditis brenneri]|uniref:Uncharacterized protein n=1 Tax=Caenorhabditis brenneri TaxID=135651 RepID=G0N5T5_CAEBE|nr:hypothetical protein CAEBREN_17431 [Caenorhabditis brenneri]